MNPEEIRKVDIGEVLAKIISDNYGFLQRLADE